MFKSEITSKGNIGYSAISQELADQQAVAMDNNNCTDCDNCHSCQDCHSCHSCHNCQDCSSCYNCHNCQDCRNCSTCHNCYNCQDCHDCHNCQDCSNCHSCHNCDNCSNCQGSLRWQGPKVSRLLSLNGFSWPISISDTHIQIGCQIHSIKFWQKVSDETLSKMDIEALDFWNTHKDIILQFTKTFKEN